MKGGTQRRRAAEGRRRRRRHRLPPEPAHPNDRGGPHPAKAAFSRASLDKLQKALALIVGTEAMIVFKDVLQLDEKEAREVKRWAIRVLIEAARE